VKSSLGIAFEFVLSMVKVTVIKNSNLIYGDNLSFIQWGCGVVFFIKKLHYIKLNDLV